MKQKVSALIMSVLILSVLCFCGCMPEKKLPEYDGEYYRYAVRTEKGQKKGYLVGLTELGKEQTELILSQEINGVPIVGIGYLRKNASLWNGPIGRLESKNLKKLYIPFSLENWDIPDSNRVQCEFCYNIRLWDMRYSLGRGGTILSYKVYKQLINDTLGNYTLYYSSKHTLLANISFMYNFDGAENEGYYWVDSYNNDLISFIPPNPKREGYTFGGWYKESECINAYNFETDKIGSELLVDVDTYIGDNCKPPQYDENDGIKLYAKWIKN